MLDYRERNMRKAREGVLACDQAFLKAVEVRIDMEKYLGQALRIRKADSTQDAVDIAQYFDMRFEQALAQETAMLVALNKAVLHEQALTVEYAVPNAA